MTANPTPAQILTALRDHGVTVRLYRGWDRADGWPDGLQGVVMHHTATRSATDDNPDPCPSLEWCATATSRAACNAIIGRDGVLWLLNAAWSYHTGNGGPWPAIGITTAGNNGHRRLWGVELDDPGTGQTMNARMVEAGARMAAAIVDVAELDTSRIITHESWTNGTDGVNPAGRSPYYGRKNDTLHPWYGAERWRLEAARHLTRFSPTPTHTPTEGEPMLATVKLDGKTTFWLITAKGMIGLASTDANTWTGPRITITNADHWGRFQRGLGVFT